MTSSQPFSEWENVFSTSAMTVAAVDRLVDHSTIIQINGESYRGKQKAFRKRLRFCASREDLKTPPLHFSHWFSTSGKGLR